MKKILLFPVIAVLFSFYSLNAQPTIKIHDVIVPPGQILVPIDMLNFTGTNGGVTTITLYISFNDDVLDFIDFTNLTIPTQGAVINFFNPFPGEITFTYTKSGAGFDINGKMMDLRLNYLGGQSSNLIITTFEATKGIELIPGIVKIHGSVQQSINTWTGSVNSDWHTPGNWSFGVPTSTVAAKIPDVTNDPVISGNAVVDNLLIESGAVLTIAPTGTLSVSGPLTNNAGTGGIVIQSSASGTGSLINTSANVSATVRRYISGSSGAWHQLSSPVQTQNITGAGAGNFASGASFFAWYEPVQTWVSFTNTSVWPTWSDVNTFNAVSGNFIPMKGYMTKYSGNPTKEFTGILNQGSTSFTLHNQAHPNDVYKAYNLIGNPYPSAIDWKAPAGWSGRNNLQNVGGGYSIWIWNDASGNYGTYNSSSAVDNGTLGTSRYIASMQGFWVRAANNLGILEMNNQVRVHNTQPWLKEQVDLSDILHLKVGSTVNSYSDEVILEFGHETYQGGSEKMFSMYGDAPSLYMIKDENHYSINFLTDVSLHPAVNLSFKAGENGLYTLEMDDSGFMYEVILEDLKTGIQHTLKVNEPYNFIASTNDNPDRFMLHFKALGTELPENSERVRVFYNNGWLNVLNAGNETSKIEVYNIAGSLVKYWELPATNTYRKSVDLNPGVYVVKLMNKSTSASNMIIVF